MKVYLLTRSGLSSKSTNKCMCESEYWHSFGMGFHKRMTCVNVALLVIPVVRVRLAPKPVVDFFPFFFTTSPVSLLLKLVIILFDDCPYLRGVISWLYISYALCFLNVFITYRLACQSIGLFSGKTSSWCD